MDDEMFMELVRAVVPYQDETGDKKDERDEKVEKMEKDEKVEQKEDADDEVGIITRFCMLDES